jgi:hypothetical protein
MNLNILSIILFFVLFIPVSFANGVDDPVLDDFVYDDAARAAIEKSQVGVGNILNSESILINDDEKIYLFSQTLQRDSNGNLVSFFQSDKMTQISPSTIHYFLDTRATIEPIPVYDFDGRYVQAYGEKFSNIIPLKDITASTMLVVEVHNTGNLDFIPPPSLAARFAHDGIILEPGDVITTTWWVARVLN